jgi:hypothetical protein
VIHQHAESFGARRFRKQLRNLVETEWPAFHHRMRASGRASTLSDPLAAAAEADPVQDTGLEDEQIERLPRGASGGVGPD